MAENEIYSPTDMKQSSPDVEKTDYGPNYYEDRFKVDRKKLEQMIPNGSHNYSNTNENRISNSIGHGQGLYLN